MTRTISIEQHAVFATLASGQIVRVSRWLDWGQAIDMWTAMDDQRRDAIKGKGLIALYRGAVSPIQVKHYEVRSENDPAYKDLPDGSFSFDSNFLVLSREYTTDTAAAKGVLRPLGYHAKSGGWVYEGKNGDGSDSVVAQGWLSTATQVGHRVLRLEGEQGYRAIVTHSLQTKVA